MGLPGDEGVERVPNGGRTLSRGLQELTALGPPALAPQTRASSAVSPGLTTLCPGFLYLCLAPLPRPLSDGVYSVITATAWWPCRWDRPSWNCLFVTGPGHTRALSGGAALAHTAMCVTL